MKLELETEDIADAIRCRLMRLSLPIDWQKGIRFTVYDGDGESLEVEDVRATLTIQEEPDSP